MRTENDYETPNWLILEVHHSNKEWDMVTVCGKILSVKQATAMGSQRKLLNLMEAVYTNETGIIPIDIWESNIGEVHEVHKRTS